MNSESSTYDPSAYAPALVAKCVDNNQPGSRAIIEARSNETIPIGTMLIACPHPDLSHDCCIWCGMNMAIANSAQIALASGAAKVRHANCECADGQWLMEYPAVCGQFRHDEKHKKSSRCANCEHEESCHKD